MSTVAVDLRAALEGARPYLARAGLSNEQLRAWSDVQSAAAELVAACKARDLAYGRSIQVGIEYGNLSPQAATAQRELTEANLRYFDALARVQGGAA